MDLAFAPEDEAFRREVRGFLEEALTPDLKEGARLQTYILPAHHISQRWQQILHARGWAAPDWPSEYGGPGWSLTRRYIFASECARAGTPRLSPLGLQMAAPVIMGHGTEAQKAHYLPRILSAEDVWCQGYSEPGSGSDLASLQCRAVADGEDYIVNGAKIWTTNAHNANRMFCLVRTSNEGRPQEGISFLLIDMATPGIRVEPIITLSGDHEFNQVFFDDVRVPQANRVGAENDGWTVAKYLLEFERGGNPYASELHASLDAVADLARLRPAGGRPLSEDAGFRRRLADLRVEVTGIEFTEHRSMAELEARGRPGPASSMTKARGSSAAQAVSELAVEAIGYYAAPFQPEARVPGNNADPITGDDARTVMAGYLNLRASTIAGGSNEIQHNIMAKLVLGL